MDILISIKPTFVKGILNGTKKFEYRKKIWKRNLVNPKIYIYSSSPVKRIMGYFICTHIINETVSKLWEMTKLLSGIWHNDFQNYFKDKERGIALEISHLKIFDTPIEPTTLISNFKAPQNFMYFENNLI